MILKHLINILVIYVSADTCTKKKKVIQWKIFIVLLLVKGKNQCSFEKSVCSLRQIHLTKLIFKKNCFFLNHPCSSERKERTNIKTSDTTIRQGHIVWRLTESSPLVMMLFCAAWISLASLIILCNTSRGFAFLINSCYKIK